MLSSDSLYTLFVITGLPCLTALLSCVAHVAELCPVFIVTTPPVLFSALPWLTRTPSCHTDSKSFILKPHLLARSSAVLMIGYETMYARVFAEDAWHFPVEKIFYLNIASAWFGSQTISCLVKSIMLLTSSRASRVRVTSSLTRSTFSPSSVGTMASSMALLLWNGRSGPGALFPSCSTRSQLCWNH